MGKSRAALAFRDACGGREKSVVPAVSQRAWCSSLVELWLKINERWRCGVRIKLLGRDLKEERFRLHKCFKFFSYFCPGGGAEPVQYEVAKLEPMIPLGWQCRADKNTNAHPPNKKVT